MARILLLGASEIQLPSILKAKELGHTVLVADFNPEAPGLACADIPLHISTNDTEAVLAAARKYQIDGIATTSDFPVRTIAAVGAKLGLCVLSEEAAKICTDKYLQRERMVATGLPTPWFFRLEADAEINSAEVRSWPAIVKPVDSSASRGVSRIDTETEYESAVALARKNSRCGAIIVEEYICGREFSVEVLCRDGLAHIIAVTAKTTVGEDGRFFVETRHVIPADIPAEDEAEIRFAVCRAVSACGLNNSAAHAEVKLSPRGPILIEMAARLGGDYITSDLVPLATGVDMVKAVLEIALGKSISTVQSVGRFAGIQFITPQNYEAAAVQIRKLASDRRLIRSQILPKPEHAVLQSSMDRLGYWIVAAETRQELLPLLEC
jgi:carbamoyl-phosphate synthase large subunit